MQRHDLAGRLGVAHAPGCFVGNSIGGGEHDGVGGMRVAGGRALPAMPDHGGDRNVAEPQVGGQGRE